MVIIQSLDMEILRLSLFAVILTAVYCEDNEELSRDKKDVSKLKNLGLGGFKNNDWSGGKFYPNYPNYPTGPAGGYLPPSYNDYNRRPSYIVPSCDVRVAPFAPPFQPRPLPAPQVGTIQSTYIPSRPKGPSGPALSPPPTSFDDTVVVYPAPSIEPAPIGPVIQQPSAYIKPIPPRVGSYGSNGGYLYGRPEIPFLH